MRTRKSTITIIGIGLCTAISAIGVAGCASETETKRTEARAAAQSFRSSLTEMPSRIDQTISKLMVLTDNRTTDKSKPLSEFRSELKKMDADARQLAAEADNATQHTDDYFTAWTREAVRTSDPNKREASQAQLDARRANYGTARSYLDEARRHYVELTASLHDIDRMYTAGGVDVTLPATRSKIDKAIQDSAYVKNYVARLGEQVDATLGVKK